MRPSSAKTLFACVVTSLGLSLLWLGGQDVHGSSCATESCQSCVFCSLATPACLESCPNVCAQPVSSFDSSGPTQASGQAGLPADLEADSSQVVGIDELDIDWTATCPVALDLIEEATPAPSAALGDAP
jgi:hypothetical protein